MLEGISPCHQEYLSFNILLSDEENMYRIIIPKPVMDLSEGEKIQQWLQKCILCFLLQVVQIMGKYILGRENIR